MQDQLELADFFAIAEAILGMPGEQLVLVTRIPEAESALAAPFAAFGGVEFYPEPVDRAAICCSRIVRNHPLPDGNKRVGFECMREMLDRSKIVWVPNTATPNPDALLIEALAARTIPEDEFILWVRDRVGP